MASLAFAFPLRAGKTEEWRAWVREILGPRRSECEAFSQKLGLGTQRWYLQHTPQGDQAIIYLEGDDLERTFQHLRTAQDPLTIWVRQRTQDLFGVDLTQTEPGALSQYVFTWPSAQEDEANYKALEGMERLGMIIHENRSVGPLLHLAKGRHARPRGLAEARAREHAGHWSPGRRRDHALRTSSRAVLREARFTRDGPALQRTRERMNARIGAQEHVALVRSHFELYNSRAFCNCSLSLREVVGSTVIVCASSSVSLHPLFPE